MAFSCYVFFFFFNDTATTEIYTLSLHDALPIACTGRLSNRVYSFFVETGEREAAFKPEPGLSVTLMTPAELLRMIRAGEFVQQLHLGALMLAELHSFLSYRA